MVCPTVSSLLSPLSLSHSVCQLTFLDAPPVPEGHVVLRAGEDDHEGEGGEGPEGVEDGEGEEEGRLDGENVLAGDAGIDELPLLPEVGWTETEAGLVRPGGRGVEGRGTGGRAEGGQVEGVGDGGHQAEHRAHQ